MLGESEVVIANLSSRIYARLWLVPNPAEWKIMAIRRCDKKGNLLLHCPESIQENNNRLVWQTYAKKIISKGWRLIVKAAEGAYYRVSRCAHCNILPPAVRRSGYISIYVSLEQKKVSFCCNITTGCLLSASSCVLPYDKSQPTKTFLRAINENDVCGYDPTPSTVDFNPI